MFVSNFKKIIVSAIKYTGTSETITLKTTTGGDESFSNSISLHDFLITNFGISKYSQLYSFWGGSTPATTFAFGDGEAATNESDIQLGNLITDTDFKILSHDVTNNGTTQLLSLTFQYNGTTPVTINEVGLFIRRSMSGTYNRPLCMLARASKGDLDKDKLPIFTPISLSGTGSEVFVLSMAIG